MSEGTDMVSVVVSQRLRAFNKWRHVLHKYSLLSPTKHVQTNIAIFQNKFSTLWRNSRHPRFLRSAPFPVREETLDVWASEGGGLLPWISKISVKKGCFVSFKWEKTNFTTFAPL